MFNDKEDSENYFDYREANIDFLVFAVDENARAGFNVDHYIDYFDFLAGNWM